MLHPEGVRIPIVCKGLPCQSLIGSKHGIDTVAIPAAIPESGCILILTTCPIHARQP